MNWSMGSNGKVVKAKSQATTSVPFQARTPGRVKAKALSPEAYAAAGNQFLGRSKLETQNILGNNDQTFESDRFKKGKFGINAKRKGRGAAASILGSALNGSSGLGI